MLREVIELEIEGGAFLGGQVEGRGLADPVGRLQAPQVAFQGLSGIGQQ